MEELLTSSGACHPLIEPPSDRPVVVAAFSFPTLKQSARQDHGAVTASLKRLLLKLLLS
jgi:hypothetical protein